MNVKEFCNLCNTIHNVSLYEIMKNNTQIPDAIIDVIISYSLKPNELEEELKYCVQCKICVPRIHCQDKTCNTYPDPHHLREIKKNHKKCYICDQCHIIDLPHCDQCNQCHNDSFAYCELCNKCIPPEDESANHYTCYYYPISRIDTSASNLKFHNYNKHCISEKCVLNPHHIYLAGGDTMYNNFYCDYCCSCHSNKFIQCVKCSTCHNKKKIRIVVNVKSVMIMI